MAAVELAASAGLHLDPWQAWALTQSLGEDADELWTALEVAIIVARQNGKGSIVEARELLGLFLLQERMLHTAHEFKTCTSAFRRVWGLIESTPDLSRHVKRVLQNTTETSIELHSGAKIQFIARSKSSGRGLSADVLILDEAYELSDEALAALMPTLSASENPQVWYTSSAPVPGSPGSDVLRRVCKRGRSDSRGRLAYMEWSVDPKADIDPDDPERLAESNPGLGIRVGEDFINDVERPTMTTATYAVERLTIFDTDDEGTHKVIPAERWIACQDPEHRPSGPLAYAVDVSPDARSAAVATSDGVHIEIVKYEAGTAWVVPAVVLKRDQFSEIVLDPAGPAAGLIVPLEAAGIKVRQLTTQEAVSAAQGFLSDVEDARIRHLGQSELTEAAANADKRDIGDGNWLWSRKKSTVDISPLVAATSARFAALATVPAPDAGFVDLNDFLEE